MNAAVRVCASAAGGKVLASEDVLQAVNANWFRFLLRGPVQLRGVPEPLELYEFDWQSGSPEHAN